MQIIKKALKQTLSKLYYSVITLSVALNILFFYYFILIQTTTWDIFWKSNIAIYNWLQIILSIINAVLIGLAISMFLYILEEKRKKSQLSFLGTIGSFIFSGAATGCTVCGAFLLPTLGIATSLTALPFGGLEIKTLSIFLLVYVIYEYSKSITDLCQTNRLKIISFGKKGIIFNFSKKTLPQLKPFVILAGFVFIIYALPYLPKSWRINFQKNQTASTQTKKTTSNENYNQLFSQINPSNGYEINPIFGNLGPKMISSGVIDLNKFKEVYERAGRPLTDNQLQILTKGSNSKIKIDSENSYFLLNFFWAVGLANNNKILTQGAITKYGKNQIGNFASTGGWSLSKTTSMNYFAKLNLISLTPQQQQRVEEVSSNIYRPCCNNSTAFPDCNHGMALLGVLQLMSANNATEKEMYQAGKYFNAFWFPQSYYDIALYFKSKEGKDFKDIDPKLLLSQDYSSVSGWKNTKNWLSQNGVVKQAPKSGSGCGV